MRVIEGDYGMTELRWGGSFVADVGLLLGSQIGARPAAPAQATDLTATYSGSHCIEGRPIGRTTSDSAH
jgi:hypothetical protein